MLVISLESGNSFDAVPYTSLKVCQLLSLGEAGKGALSLTNCCCWSAFGLAGSDMHMGFFSAGSAGVGLLVCCSLAAVYCGIATSMHVNGIGMWLVYNFPVCRLRSRSDSVVLIQNASLHVLQHYCFPAPPIKTVPRRRCCCQLNSIHMFFDAMYCMVSKHHLTDLGVRCTNLHVYA